MPELWVFEVDRTAVFPSSKSTLPFPGCEYTSKGLNYVTCVPVATLTQSQAQQKQECDDKYRLSSILLDMRTGEGQAVSNQGRF